MNTSNALRHSDPATLENQIDLLLGRMTLAEKIGQMRQVHASDGHPPGYLAEDLRAGRIGSVINNVDVQVINELQRIAVEESRLGIPLLIGRDVIHGFKTILPIPLGQAATWNPDLVAEGARVAAQEAATSGVNWTFAPMVDVSRDARWGRIAESFGEDVYLSEQFAAAMVTGFQGNNLKDADAIAACVKHFAGYGASESGKDYATTNIPEHELRNVYLPPFKAGIDAGALTLMTSFSDLNGVPATGNAFLLRQILREEWQFDGMVVSDWDSVRQLQIHGLTGNPAQSAFEALTAGVDMEMAGDAYILHLEGLIEKGDISVEQVDSAVARILRAKFRLGLFERSQTDVQSLPPVGGEHALRVARRAALESVVLLKNDNAVLPLSENDMKSLAVIGPLADAPYEQLGTWIFDGDAGTTVTPLRALRERFENTTDIRFVQAMQHSRSKVSESFDEAVAAAAESDAVLLFLGEESILSGEAHSRADISLPGDQAELVRRIRQTGRPVIAIIMAGRPLTLTNIVDHVDALLFAWHPGTMGGPALTDLIFGDASPSGKLPASFPRMVGQIPIYYNQKNGGKPPTDDTVVHIDDIDTFAPQTSFGMSAFHLDAGYKPLFPFGFGLSYTTFEYRDIAVNPHEVSLDKTVTVSATLTNAGAVAASEVAQLYTRDVAAQVTRPVRELKGFKRIHLEPGQSTTVQFELGPGDLAFYGKDMQKITEPGVFHVWIGGDSQTDLRTEFRLVEAGHAKKSN